jgi:Tol biopolymer transport system component
LTEGNGFNPDCSPDGSEVVYSDGSGHIRKISIDGGPTVELSKSQAYSPVISPDARFVAWMLFDEATRKSREVIAPLAGGPPLRTMDLPNDTETPWVRWTPDGKALSYIQTNNGVSNLWRASIDGSTPTQLTHFTSGQIFNYAWSRDGKQLAMARGSETSDVVLIKIVP